MAANPLQDPIAPQALPLAEESLVHAVRLPGGGTSPASSSPWPEPSPHVDVPWDPFRRFHGLLEAQIVAGRLEAEGVPTVILSVPGVWDAFAEIRVPRSLLHRAHWVLSWPPVSDEELLLLATGELVPVDQEKTR